MSGGEDEDKMVAGGKVVWEGIFSLKTLSCQRVDNTKEIHGSEACASVGSVITVVHQTAREKKKRLIETMELKPTKKKYFVPDPL